MTAAAPKCHLSSTRLIHADAEPTILRESGLKPPIRLCHKTRSFRCAAQPSRQSANQLTGPSAPRTPALAQFTPLDRSFLPKINLHRTMARGK
jgi:hypothetical protein